MNFLFVDYTTKEIGIHFVDLMPDEQNIEREKHMDSMGIPFENIYPPLKTLHITNEYRAKFPEYYYLPDVPDYAKFYKEKYLQDRI
ncbi:MAG: hypothetical protein LBD75_03850 [Candidatus Peribacteria bacterium]|jgi:hypothetical protein|nr:hypothetical protein [Candidatus Peribacteria bacterium]